MFNWNKKEWTNKLSKYVKKLKAQMGGDRGQREGKHRPQANFKRLVNKNAIIP